MEAMELDDDKLQISKRLREVRKATGLSQREFAQKLGLSESGYRKYELGKTLIPADRLATLVEVFGVSADYIVLGKKSNFEEAWTSYMNCSLLDQGRMIYRALMRLSFYTKGILLEQEKLEKLDELFVKTIVENGLMESTDEKEDTNT